MYYVRDENGRNLAKHKSDKRYLASSVSHSPVWKQSSNSSFHQFCEKKRQKQEKKITAEEGNVSRGARVR